MKKIIISLVAFIYLASSIGITFHLHYCMGNFVKWGFGFDQLAHCPACGMDEAASDGCCRGEYSYVKSDIDQKAGKPWFYSHKISEIASPQPQFEISSLPSYFCEQQTNFSKSPPYNLLPAYLFNGNLRI